MVGGTVVGISRKGGETLLNVKDRTYGDECAVRCVERRVDDGRHVHISLGDQVWWQCGRVMWTPVPCGSGPCGKDWDIQLPKVGYSH